MDVKVWVCTKDGSNVEETSTLKSLFKVDVPSAFEINTLVGPKKLCKTRALTSGKTIGSDRSLSLG